MGLPILIPFCPHQNTRGRMLWIPVHVKDIERYGLRAVLKAVKTIGMHGLKLKRVGSPAAMNLLDGKLTAALSAVEDEDEGESPDEDEGKSSDEDEGESSDEDEGESPDEDEGKSSDEDDDSSRGEI